MVIHARNGAGFENSKKEKFKWITKRNGLSEQCKCKRKRWRLVYVRIWICLRASRTCGNKATRHQKKSLLFIIWFCFVFVANVQWNKQYHFDTHPTFRWFFDSWFVDPRLWWRVLISLVAFNSNYFTLHNFEIVSLALQSKQCFEIIID